MLDVLFWILAVIIIVMAGMALTVLFVFLITYIVAMVVYAIDWFIHRCSRGDKT